MLHFINDATIFQSAKGSRQYLFDC